MIARARVRRAAALHRRRLGVHGQVVAEGEPLPAFDLHASMVSLPHLCRVDFGSLSREPYLRAPAQSRIKLGHLDKAKLRVGIYWAAMPGQVQDRQRSAPFSQFLALAGDPELLVFSLQGGVHQRDIQSFKPGIKQIHNADIDLVDRCESCHLATRAPIVVTAADMGGRKEFTSHPHKELLQMHDPERFGCSTCHNGNGRATTSVTKAHGDYEHWLWPLFKPANVEAGCQTCHQADMFLQSGAVGQTIYDGKFLFRQRGGNGMTQHRYSLRMGIIRSVTHALGTGWRAGLRYSSSVGRSSGSKP